MKEDKISLEGIWGKLTELDKKIDTYIKKVGEEQKSQTNQETLEHLTKKDLKGIISDEVKLFKEVFNSQAKSNKEITEELTDNIKNIRKQLTDQTYPETTNLDNIKDLLSKEQTFSILGIKLNRMTAYIVVLTIFSFMTTTIAMKQDADYTILKSVYSKQNRYIENLRLENDSLKVTSVTKKKEEKKKR